MKILAMESSALTASVAVCEDDKLLAEYTVNNGNTHSENLLPMAESILSLLGMSAADVDLFAVSAGPGSFTGVRIGVSTIKGLAFGTEKPCIGVSTLEALAYQLQSVTGLVCPVMNARRRQVYTALFRVENGTVTRLMEDCAISVEELDERLSAYEEPIYLTGDGFDLVKGALSLPFAYTQDKLRYQSGASVAASALAAYRAGVRTTHRELAPVYLRPCQAERERAERMKNEAAE